MEEQPSESARDIGPYDLAFAGIGWHTGADALMANSAANARARRLAARDALTDAV